MRFRKTISIHRKAAKGAKIKALSQSSYREEMGDGKTIFFLSREVIGTEKETLLENRPLTDSPEIIFPLRSPRLERVLILKDERAVKVWGHLQSDDRKP